MLIDAATMYDLLRLTVNRSDEKIKKLADSLFKVYDANVGNLSASDVKYCELYISLCKEVIGNQLNVSDHKVELINIFKRHITNPAMKRDTYIKDALTSVINTCLSPSRLADITKNLNNVVSWYVSNDYITKLYGHLKESKLSYSSDKQTETLSTMRSIVDEFRDTMAEVDTITGKGGAVEVINMSDRDSIKSAYALYKERRVTNVLKTGLQGLNQMFGGAGGMALGESILFSARSHHFKSGMLMKMANWIATYGKPADAPGKKPMILVISLENEGYQNMMTLFKHLYTACHKVSPPDGMSDDEMVDSIFEYFSKSPFTLVIERYLPDSFGYEELTKLYEKYTDSGYSITACILDYVTQMRTYRSGSASKAAKHDLLQSLCNKVVNYFKAVGTTFISAAQLNRGASDIAATGIPHPVKHYSERHLADSSGIFREFDFVCYLEIEKDDAGNPWLTMCWGKHRYVDDTNPTHKFVAYRLYPDGIGLVDDIDGPAHTGSRNIYSKKDAKTATTADIDSILGITRQETVTV